MKSVQQILHITGFEMIRKLMSWRFPVAMTAAIVILALAYVNGMSSMREGFSYEPAYDLLSPFVESSTMVLAISAVIMTSDTLSDEFEKRSGYIMFTRPMHRNALYIGKLLSSFLLSAIVLIAYYSITFIICVHETGHIPSGNLEGMALAAMFLFTVTTSCMVFSSLSPRGSMSLTLSFALMVIAPMFIKNMSFDNEPWFSLSYSSDAIGSIALGELPVYHMVDGVATSIVHIPDATMSAIVFCVYSMISIMISALVFRYRTW